MFLINVCLLYASSTCSQDSLKIYFGNTYVEKIKCDEEKIKAIINSPLFLKTSDRAQVVNVDSIVITVANRLGSVDVYNVKGNMLPEEVIAKFDNKEYGLIIMIEEVFYYSQTGEYVRYKYGRGFRYCKYNPALKDYKFEQN